MMNLKPEELLKMMQKQEAFLKDVQTMSVKVGLPKKTASIKEKGISIIIIGAAHEYGQGDMHRSFLRVPFAVRKDELAKIIQSQFELGKSKLNAKLALGRVGALASGISKKAFTNQGYGTWADIKPETKKRKKSSKVLIDTSTLSQSITWEVEKNAS